MNSQALDKLSFVMAQPIANFRRLGVAARPHYDRLFTPPVRAAVVDYSRGPLAMIPGVVLLVAIQVATALGDWDVAHVMALSIGLTSGMLGAAIFLPAIGRRASIYVAADDNLSLRHYVYLSLCFLGATGIAVIASLLIGMGQLGILTPETRAIFAMSNLGLGFVWLLGGWLSLLGKPAWPVVSLVVGLVTFVVTDQLLALLVSFHIAPAALAGFGAAIGLQVWALQRRLVGRKDNSAQSRPFLPSPPYLAWEAAPNLAYGVSSILFIIVPHALGFLGASQLQTGQLEAFANIEVALTLALPPFVLAGGVTERTLRLFWRWSQEQLEAIHGDQPGAFRNSVTGFFRRQFGVFAVTVTVCSVLLAFVIGSAFTADPLPGWMVDVNGETVMLIFVLSLVCYGFLGLAYFSTSICLTLNRPTAALTAGAMGLLTMIGLGIPLCLFLDYRQSLIAFLAGAFVYAVLTARSVSRVLDSSDYHLFASG